MTFRRKMLNMANSVIRPFGFVLKSVNQPIRGFEKFFQGVTKKGFRPATVFDVGVGFGTWDLYDAFPHAKFVLVEPIKEQEDTLRRIADTYDAEYHLTAIGDRQGEIEITVETNRLEHSSVHERTSLKIAKEGGISRVIPVCTLDSLTEKHDYKRPYLLKIDVEGAELSALRGAAEMMCDVEMVVVEVSIAKRFEEDTDFHDIVVLMHGHGFVVFDIVGAATNKAGMMSHIDLVFVRLNSTLRKV